MALQQEYYALSVLIIITREEDLKQIANHVLRDRYVVDQEHSHLLHVLWGLTAPRVHFKQASVQQDITVIHLVYLRLSHAQEGHIAKPQEQHL